MSFTHIEIIEIPRITDFDVNGFLKNPLLFFSEDFLKLVLPLFSKEKVHIKSPSRIEKRRVIKDISFSKIPKTKDGLVISGDVFLPKFNFLLEQKKLERKGINRFQVSTKGGIFMVSAEYILAEDYFICDASDHCEENDSLEFESYFFCPTKKQA